MSSRRSIRRPLVALLLGVLVGGGLMAVTPAGAEVSNAVATNWKKIWNKELKPQADKRYYTKKKSNKRYYTKSDSDAKYQPKGNYALNGSSYTKAESDAKYAGAGSAYTKAESDGKYQSKSQLIRGSYFVGSGSPVYGLGSFSFGATLASAPTVHYINAGAAIPSGCSGSASAPDAVQGHLCVFETTAINATGRFIGRGSDGATGQADPFGFTLEIDSAGGAGGTWARGTWAVRVPAAGTVANRVPSTEGGVNPEVSGGRQPGS